MAENSAIEWTDHTWSPWEGCQKTGSMACENCYAEARNARFGGGTPPNWGPHAPRKERAESAWKTPLKWDRQAKAEGKRLRVFPSLCDPFDNKAPEGARARFARLILDTPNLDWLLLTKRIGNAAAMLAEMFPAGTPTNVWLGATVVTQEEANRDIPILLTRPAAKRFLSMEPLMGEVDLTQIDTMAFRLAERLNALTGELFGMFGEPAGWMEPRLDWIIVGLESGRNARFIASAPVRSLRDQCAAARVPFLFKQWGEWIPEDQCAWLDPSIDTHNVPWEPGFYRLGKKLTGRLLDGRLHNEIPGVVPAMEGAQ